MLLNYTKEISTFYKDLFGKVKINAHVLNSLTLKRLTQIPHPDVCRKLSVEPF